jgi:transposase
MTAGNNLGPPGDRDGEGRASPDPANVEKVVTKPPNYSRQTSPPRRHDAPYDESAARDLDSAIRVVARQIHIAWEALVALVNEAKAGEIHKALGFPSWTAYIADALDGQWRIERDKRGEVVKFLADQGMSQRAIVKVTGIGKGTVYRELAQVPQLGQLITGLDGKTYPRPQPREDDGESDEDFLARMKAEDAGGAFTIPATIEDVAARLNQFGKDQRRLQRITFDMAFTALQEQPNDARRAARELGLHIRWMRTLVVWGMEDGRSIEDIADDMGVSVGMVEDYLDAPTSSNDEFLAAVCGQVL